MYLDASRFRSQVQVLGKERGRGENIFKGGGMSQVLLFGLPREGRNHLHGPWTECRVRGEEKTRPAVLDARSGDTDSERGVKGEPHQGREDKGCGRGADQAPGFLSSGPRRRAGATCAPRRGRSAAGCGDGLGESRELAFPLGNDREGLHHSFTWEARLPEDGFTRLCPRDLVCRRSQSERLH